MTNEVRIYQFEDNKGNKVAPKVPERAVVDSKGVTLDQKLEGLGLDAIKEAQDAAIAAVEASSENLSKNTGISEYETFSDQKSYSAGDTVIYNGLLYTFTADHSAGAWDESQVESASLKAEFDDKINNIEDNMNNVIVDIDSYDDFNICDRFGNILFYIRNGHIYTKKFSSDNVLKNSYTESTDEDFNISDEDGNILLLIKNGYISLKNFITNNQKCILKDNNGNIIFDSSDVYKKEWTDYDDIVRCKYSNSDNPIKSGEGSTSDAYQVISVTEGERYYIKSLYNQWLTPILCLNDKDEYIANSRVADEGKITNGFTYVIPKGATKLLIWFNIGYLEKEFIYRLTNKTNVPKWIDKNMVFFGTSIPAGFGAGLYTEPQIDMDSYPSALAKMQQCTIYNEAVGSSCVCCRKQSLVNEDTNPYGFVNDFERVSRCLTNTSEMMEWVINNYNSDIFTVNKPSSLSDDIKNVIRYCSYENKLLPYLNGDRQTPDLFLFEHGHNDESTDNFVEDTDASLGMFSYAGCMSFLFRLIRSYIPKAKIAIVSNYTNQGYTSQRIVEAQKMVAELWGVPFIDISNKMQYSEQKITTNGYWEYINGSKSYGWWHDYGGEEQEITMRDLYLADGVHPHTDRTGKANRDIAKQINNIINLIF